MEPTISLGRTFFFAQEGHYRTPTDIYTSSRCNCSELLKRNRQNADKQNKTTRQTTGTTPRAAAAEPTSKTGASPSHQRPAPQANQAHKTPNHPRGPRRTDPPANALEQAKPPTAHRPTTQASPPPETARTKRRQQPAQRRKTQEATGGGQTLLGERVKTVGEGVLARELVLRARFRVGQSLTANVTKQMRIFQPLPREPKPVAGQGSASNWRTTDNGTSLSETNPREPKVGVARGAAATPGELARCPAIAVA